METLPLQLQKNVRKTILVLIVFSMLKAMGSVPVEFFCGNMFTDIFRAFILMY